MSLIQMTTPDVVFDVDVDLTEARAVSVAFKQSDRVVLLLDKPDLTITADSIRHTFTQEETGRFNCRVPLKIQIKAMTADGRVISHEEPITTSVAEIFDRRVFADE